MKQVSVVVRRDRAGLVREALDRMLISTVGVFQTTVRGLGPAPRLQHRGRSYDDDRCLRLDVVVSDAQADAVADLVRKSCGERGYLLWSLPIEGPARDVLHTTRGVGVSVGAGDR